MYINKGLVEVKKHAEKYPDGMLELKSQVAVVSGARVKSLEVIIRDNNGYWNVEKVLEQLFRDKTKSVRVDYKVQYTLNLPEKPVEALGMSTSPELTRGPKQRSVHCHCVEIC